MQTSLLLTALGVAIALFSAIVGAIASFVTISRQAKAQREEDKDRFVDSVKKQYAAERDFNHLKNDFANLSGNINAIFDDLEKRIDNLEGRSAEINGMLKIIINKVSNNNEKDLP